MRAYDMTQPTGQSPRGSTGPFAGLLDYIHANAIIALSQCPSDSHTARQTEKRIHEYHFKSLLLQQNIENKNGKFTRGRDSSPFYRPVGTWGDESSEQFSSSPQRSHITERTRKSIKAFSVQQSKIMVTSCKEQIFHKMCFRSCVQTINRYCGEIVTTALNEMCVQCYSLSSAYTH